MSRGDSFKKWRDSICWSMERLIGKDIHGRDLSVENLFYPFDMVEAIIHEFHLSVCLDIGHLVMVDADIEKTFDSWPEKTAIVHLHGVKNKQDHLALDHMPPKQMETIIRRLSRFNGTVSIEVFSFPELSSSLNFLEHCWEKRYKD
jgi:sugar phosphate isomerase/epimerase